MRFGGCGIAGVLRLDSAAGPCPGAADIRAVTGALTHRGPDTGGIWAAQGIILGHRRLSITGPGDAGTQPMTRDHLTITYNGEAYNYRSLRAGLDRDYPFTSGTDTEVVLRAWQEWGTAALTRLAGMYAFAIWDARARSLTLVRDRIGIKPLYCHRGNGFLVFASEAQALLRCPLVPRQPDIESLSRHLLLSSALQPGRHRTLVDGITALPPATCLTVHADGREHTSTYWTLPSSRPRAPVPSRRQLAGELRDLLTDSVTGMSAADVPVASFLSGGLDSSAITAIGSAAGGITAVTLTHGGEDGDLRCSRILARHCQPRVRHHVLTRPAALTLADIDAVCDLAALCDDPRHPAILANYAAVRGLGLRAVLNGQGADELMGGYAGLPPYTALIRAGAQADITTLPAFRQAPGLSAEVLARRGQAHKEFGAFCDSLPGPPLERLHRLLLSAQVARIVQFEDFLSMRASVEARFPFLDHRIAEWCFTTPFRLHIGPGGRQGKALLREALLDTLPQTLLDRPKQVFPHPGPGGLHACLADLAVRCESELRDDTLLPRLFSMPAPGDLAARPARFLWLLLATWRWHTRLQAIPAAASCP